MLGVGVVGTGWVSGEHVRAFENNPNSRIVAITGRVEESARQLMVEHGLDCKLYTNYGEMLEQKGLDAVVICTPNQLHPEETIRAAEAGKHVLIEKPVALNLEDLSRMRDVVRKTKVKTVVSFVLRWNPLFECIKALLADGAIGDIYMAEVDYWHGIGPWYKQYSWVTQKDKGGSSFLAAGCHAVDALRWFMGVEVKEVYAYSTKMNKEYEYDPTIVAVVKFGNGAIGKLSSSIDCTTPYKFNIDLLGDKGTIRDNLLYSKKLLPGQNNFARIPTILPDSGDVTHHPFYGEIDHFVECILESRESHVNLEDAVKTHEVCIAADISAEEHRPVELPLL